MVVGNEWFSCVVANDEKRMKYDLFFAKIYGRIKSFCHLSNGERTLFSIEKSEIYSKYDFQI